MSNLSAAAELVFTYVKNHELNGYAEIDDDIGLPDDVVITACKDLKACGKISDYEISEESVEYVQL